MQIKLSITRSITTWLIPITSHSKITFAPYRQKSRDAQHQYLVTGMRLQYISLLTQVTATTPHVVVYVRRFGYLRTMVEQLPPANREQHCACSLYGKLQVVSEYHANRVLAGGCSRDACMRCWPRGLCELWTSAAEFAYICTNKLLGFESCSVGLVSISRNIGERVCVVGVAWWSRLSGERWCCAIYCCKRKDVYAVQSVLYAKCTMITRC